VTSSIGPRQVAILGVGYVGLPLAVRAVKVGHTVVGHDTDESRVKRLASGETYVEDVPAADLAAGLDSRRLRFSTATDDLADFDVAVIAVPTPLREGSPDLSYVEAAAKALAPHLRKGATVVLESTTYPGTTEELVAPILEDGSGLAAGPDFFLGYSPERIDPGRPEHHFVGIPKLVSGIDEGSLAAVKAFYDTLVDHTIPVSGIREAELAKLLENTFRHVNIALVNEMAMFAADLDIDVWEAIDAAATKPFGYMPFRPGPGVGGHCLPIDPSYLSWQVRRRLGRPFRFVELANDINDHMPDYVIQRLVSTLNAGGRAVKGSRVLLLGLAFKANTADAREAPGAAVALRLLALGAEVRAADPHVAEEDADARIVRVAADAGELAAADAVILLTDHDAFDRAAIAATAGYVLDTRHCLPPGPNVEYL
jgi:UDP-N-acetyl-D-glucosamine dehydrogenase